MSEAELIAAARSGDKDAFVELYQQNLPYVRAIARGMLHTNDVDDLCQETFLQSFQCLPNFVGTSTFRTWITRIAMNQCLMTLRKRVQPRNGSTYLVHIHGRTGPEGEPNDRVLASHDRALETAGARLDLDRMLNKLTPMNRRLLEMAYIEDTPDREIATQLGISLSSLKSRLSRAKQQARKHL